MHSLIRITTAAFLAFCAASILRCEAAEYALGQVVLHRTIPDYLRTNYFCRPRSELADTNQCTTKKSADRQSFVVSELMTEASDGTVLYAYGMNYQSGDINAVEKRAVSDMTAALGGRAPKRFSIDGARAASWGEVRLEKISSSANEYADIKGSLEQRYGLLISTAESFEAAKDDGRPVYRVIGGDGAVVIISETKSKQAFVQRIVAAGATLAEKNFKSELRKFLLEDQAETASDTSKWADVAYMVRRLALNTTPENANKLVGEVFDSTSRQKYRSRIWAYLPTSVITHLKKGAYRAADIFGENSEFPFIREKIVSQLKLNPSEPFSEFLLYSLGRFDEAVQFNQKSPIRTVLTYAAGHAKLRACMPAVFQEVAKKDDYSLLTESIKPKSYIDDIDEEDLVTQYKSEDFKANNASYKNIQRKIKDYDKKFDEKHKQLSAAELNARLGQQSFFNDHAYEFIAGSNDDYRDGKPSLTQYLNYFNQFPERYTSRPIIQTVPRFGSLCGGALSWFDEVMKDTNSPHSDDAAYFSGWLEYHLGNVNNAMNKFEISISLPDTEDARPIDTFAANTQAPETGPTDSKVADSQAADKAGDPSTTDTDTTDANSNSNSKRDYSAFAMHQASRVLTMLAPEDALKRVENSKILSSDASFWYVALTSLYHAHQLQAVIEGARVALKASGVIPETLPVTTDPERIGEALTKLSLTSDSSLADIIYLYQAAREAQQLETALSAVGARSSNSIDVQVKTAVMKYARIKDDEEDKPAKLGPKALHRDVRQGLYLAQRSLELLPKVTEFAKLREWLHFKRITLLSQFDPVKIAVANSEFQTEFPNSSLLDDTTAEQVFAEAVIMRDMTKASATFDMMRQRFPRENAIDNAYSWMAIGWTCAGQPAKAREIDQEIVRRFPLTRHARFARERLRKPNACSDLLILYNWDYRAMTWRERNRIDAIQADLKNLQR